MSHTATSGYQQLHYYLLYYLYYVTSNSIGRLNCSIKIGKEVGN